VRISPHCYAVTGLAYIPPWTVNAGIVAGSERTLVVDTGPTALAAATIHGYASAVRPTNALLAIVTEQHLDHIGGNAFFRDRDVPVYGHARIARTDAELAADVELYNECVPDPVRRGRREAALVYKGTRILNPDQPIAEDLSLELGGIEIQILMTPGHTPSNLSVYVPSDGVLYSGDCIVTGYLPNLESGNVAAWRDWLDSLERIRALAPATVVPGHGEILDGARLQREIERVNNVLEEALRTGRTPTHPC
jgi:glyoxylase-like metal-dependent hydrolase (beta-lactamase superfamily II)